MLYTAYTVYIYSTYILYRIIFIDDFTLHVIVSPSLRYPRYRGSCVSWVSLRKTHLSTNDDFIFLLLLTTMEKCNNYIVAYYYLFLLFINIIILLLFKNVTQSYGVVTCKYIIYLLLLYSVLLYWYHTI